MLKASSWVDRFVFEIEIDVRETRQLQRDEMGVNGAIKISFDLTDGGCDPLALRHKRATVIESVDSPIATLHPLSTH